jgi:hypothetical protein
VNVLSRDQVDKLRQIRATYGLEGNPPECRVRETLPADDPFRIDRLMDGLGESAAAPPTLPPAAVSRTEPAADTGWTDEIVRRVLERLGPPRT